jgi:hypothetical protein
MAIGRVPGAALLGNLDRQGLDLGFTTNSDTLLQLDFTNFRLGINTASPQESLEVTGNILVTTGNILTSANLTYDIGATNKYWRNIYSGNLYTSNITSTNITGTLTTAIQTNITTVGTLGNLSVTGNIDAGNIISNITGNVIGSATTVTASAQPNITSLGILTALDVTGNVGAGNVSGTYLTGTLLTQAQPYITSTGILTALDVTGNVGAGNVSGTYLTGTLLTSAQPNITTLSGVTSIGASGSTVLTGTLATNAQPNVTSLGTLISLDVTGNVGAGNVSGTYLTGTLLTASQTNVTSLGTLSALTVSGNIIAQSSIVPTSNIAGNIGYADTWWSAVYANTINATNLNGTILTTNQPYISNLGNITVDSISIGGNISITGNVNGTDITANTITANTITGTLLTGNQPNITNLSNISVDSISISGNLGITGTTTAGIINADEIYESNIRVVTQETTITVTGDATGSGNVSNIALTLADTGVTAGTYGAADDETWDRIPKITVDSKGRITNIANITLTQVGNVTFTDTTISTVANLTIAPTNGYIFANSSVISDVADPVSAQDVVTLNYLTTTLSGAANSLVIGDSLVNLIDETNNSRLEITLDSELIANITANASTFYNTVNIGNISIVDNTISSSGNIYIDAQNTGIVQIVGSDALGIPVGNVITRPLNPEIGYIRFNTDNDAVEYWTGAEWTYPGAATITSETVYPDGLTASYNLTTSATPDGLLVSINGTMQQPFTSYNMSGNVITFTETPQDTDIIEIRHIVAGAVSIGSLTYGPTSKVELSTGNVNITGNLIPTANVTYDLGSDSMWWRDLYMSGSTIHIGGALLKVVDNALSFTPAGSPTPINLTSDVDPTILIANTTQVKATDNFVNVSIASANVAAFSSEGLTITGNVSADYIIGDGSQLTGLPAGYTDTNVEAYLPSYTGNISSLTTANTAMKGYVDGISSTKAELSGATFTGNITVTDSIMSNYITANVLRTTDTTIALGPNAGNTDQGLSAIAIGWNAGANTQSYYAVAIGPQAGQTQQGEYAVAIGRESAKTSQGADSVAIGRIAAQTSQGTKSVAVGFGAASNYQSNNAVAIGNSAGATYQGNSAVAIGNSSGLLYQGNLAIAIGYRAGYSYQAANTIILNATGTTINGVENQTDSFYVNPIRNATGNVGLLQYNSTTKEVTYSLDIAANSISANTYTWANGTSIITTLSSDITTANTAMQGYVDAINSTLTANAGAQAGTLATIQNNYAQLSGATFTGALAAPNISLTSALAISSGGTGGTSTSSALNNLLPSGEVSGYVLKTAGEGSYYWSAETGGGSVVGTTISTSRTYFTATSGQTVYTGITYTPGAGQLRIYINGVRQFDSAYTETNSSAVTLSTGVTSGTVVLAEVDAYTDYNVYANATYSSPVGTISSTTVQDALAELDTEKAALAGASFTGNVSTSGNLRVTDTTQSTGEGTGALVVSGGASFSGNVYISGNLQVAGTETIFNANNLSIADSLIYLADDNSGDVLDIGIVSSFTNPGYQHTGFVRDATDGVWKLFANVAAEPTTTIDFTNATYSNLRIGNLTSIGGTFTGNVGADNLSATNLTGTLTTAAQTNVTSVGTLTGLTVSGAPVPNANVSVNLGSTSAWWSILYANTHVGATATFTGNITAGNVSATNLVGAITSSQVTTALGFTPYNSTNPSGYTTNTGTVTSIATAGTVSGLTLTGGTITTSGTITLGGTLSLTSGQVTTALGYTPYNSTNPNGYISAVPNASTQVSSLGVGTAASGTSGEIRATNNITAYYSSDSRLKENVRDIPDALAKVTAIGGKLFDWTDEYIADHGGLDDYFMRKADFGVIAQDVEQVLPEAVRTREDGYLAVDYEKMCALAFAAIKELQQQVHLLEQQIKDK